jgi:hypothetical protein
MQKKIALDLDALKVESMETAPAMPVRVAIPDTSGLSCMRSCFISCNETEIC